MKNKYILVVVLALVVIGTVIGAVVMHKRSPAQSLTSAQQTKFLMDTAVEIRAFGPDAEAAVEAAFAEMARVEQLFSRHLEDSAVSQINAHAGEWVTVAPEVVPLLEKALYYSEISSGAFDITVGGLIDLWNFGGSPQRVPADEEIARVLAAVDYTAVELDADAGRVRIPVGTIIDLGGIAKGYAVDRACQVLKQHGITSGMIYAGGDITTIGSKPDGSSWRVGVQHPRQSNSLIAVLEMTDSSIVTSGDYERYFFQDNIRYHHILDPQTGYPAQGLISVTVYGGDAADADALSTALFVLGWDKGKELIESLAGYEAILMDTSSNVWVSSGLRDLAQIL